MRPSPLAPHKINAHFIINANTIFSFHSHITSSTTCSRMADAPRSRPNFVAFASVHSLHCARRRRWWEISIFRYAIDMMATLTFSFCFSFLLQLCCLCNECVWFWLALALASLFVCRWCDVAGGACQSINAYEIEMQCHNYYVLQTAKDEWFFFSFAFSCATTTVASLRMESIVALSNERWRNKTEKMATRSEWRVWHWSNNESFSRPIDPNWLRSLCENAQRSLQMQLFSSRPQSALK